MNVNTMMTTIEDQRAALEVLTARVAELEAKINAPKVEVQQMTESDAINVLSGELSEASHKIAAEKLNLTYGQVYSARMGFTFKHVVKKLKSEGVKSKWIK